MSTTPEDVAFETWPKIQSTRSTCSEAKSRKTGFWDGSSRCYGDAFGGLLLRAGGGGGGRGSCSDPSSWLLRLSRFDSSKLQQNILQYIVRHLNMMSVRLWMRYIFRAGTCCCTCTHRQQQGRKGRDPCCCCCRYRSNRPCALQKLESKPTLSLLPAVGRLEYPKRKPCPPPCSPLLFRFKLRARPPARPPARPRAIDAI